MMRKLLLFVAAVLAVTMLSAPAAYAAPSPTEPDRLVDIEDPEVPLIDIEDEEVPLAFVPAPQTGVNGLTGMEALTLAAAAFTMSGAVILVKARKQTGSVR